MRKGELRDFFKDSIYNVNLYEGSKLVKILDIALYLERKWGSESLEVVSTNGRFFEGSLSFKEKKVLLEFNFERMRTFTSPKGRENASKIKEALLRKDFGKAKLYVLRHQSHSHIWFKKDQDTIV